MNTHPEYIKKDTFVDDPRCPLSFKEMKHIFVNREFNGFAPCFIHPTPRTTLIDIDVFFGILESKKCKTFRP